MYLQFKQFHSFIAYLVLAVLIFVLIYSIYSWLTKKSYTKNNRILVLLGMALVHIQFLLGVLLYFLSPLGLSNFSGEAMKNSISRLYILEHPFVMVIAFTFITIGFMKSNRINNDNQKYKSIVLFYSIALICILSRIPWSVWI